MIYFSEEVLTAQKEKKPLVALESTIIAHGMPYPKNMETALEVEEMVRRGGAVPATVAILDGKICVGLTNDQLQLLAKAEDVWKVSLRDLAYVVSQKLNGATTVASTMRIASMAGIQLFVTGGIGGVHRGAEKTMDISADLTEMAITNVAVVSAGVKSILDIGLTLEYLETLGVPVVTYHSDEFPSFYSRQSGFKSPLRIDAPKHIASLLSTKWEMKHQGSVLIANPIPREDEIPFDEMEKIIETALKDADKHQIHGKRITPFLLSRIAQLTGGSSLEANIRLVKNNAMLGAAIAVELQKLGT